MKKSGGFIPIIMGKLYTDILILYRSHMESVEDLRNKSSCAPFSLRPTITEFFSETF